ncbi:hypothetical protein [Salicibibacter kimchii]|uniref:Uncharacterized protein n=1 Tax=Salicibibacter kimchii TaxID=2099786 RepID=A0A345BVR7_9BACI|nr:hypothetical protein [Salicibibacter kimchii]AXF55048.1 hypothetical protein DT065_02815 [Salicibibacter kimchii]
MENFTQTNREHRFRAYVSTLGTSQLHLRNPYIVACWSGLCPGFGHVLLSNYLRGFLLFLTEMFLNVMTHLNQAVIYSFTGQTELAKDILDPRWLLLFAPLYIFAIWDSYRSTVDANKQFLLADHENAPFSSFTIGSTELNYLDKRSPGWSVFWSLMTPGLGQLYLNRILFALLVVSTFIVFVYFSYFLVAVHYLFLGQTSAATQVLNPQWFLFIPSKMAFPAFDAYVHAVENNKLYEHEQRNFLKQHYQDYRVKMK